MLDASLYRVKTSNRQEKYPRNYVNSDKVYGYKSTKSNVKNTSYIANNRRNFHEGDYKNEVKSGNQRPIGRLPFFRQNIRPDFAGDGKSDCSTLQGNVPDPNNPGKILICHIPPGDPTNPQTLSIAPSGINGHKNDCSDYDGPCSPPPNQCEFSSPDCAGVCGGKSILDCAGVCYDPTKGPPPTIVGCDGVCGSTTEYDCAGNCYDYTKELPPVTKGCDGVCGSGKVPGCDGVCGSGKVAGCDGVCNSMKVADCKGVCEGNAIFDCDGMCFDPDTEQPSKVRDCNGICGGPGFLDCAGNCVDSNCTWNGKPIAYAQRKIVKSTPKKNQTRGYVVQTQNKRKGKMFSPKNE